MCPLLLAPFKTMGILYSQGWIPRGTYNLPHTTLNANNVHMSCDRDGGELSSLFSVLQLSAALFWNKGDFAKDSWTSFSFLES